MQFTHHEIVVIVATQIETKTTKMQLQTVSKQSLQHIPTHPLNDYTSWQQPCLHMHCNQQTKLLQSNVLRQLSDLDRF